MNRTGRTEAAPIAARRRTFTLLGCGVVATLSGLVRRARASVPPPLSAAPADGTGAKNGSIPPGWRHQTLPKVERVNDFQLVSDGGDQVVRVRSSASASSWVSALAVDPSLTPLLRWRWKVSHSLKGSDLRNKGGDDYSARLYVFFDLPSERLSLGDRLRIQAARLLSGTDIPAAALCYVWGHGQAVGTTAWNPYTDRVRMIVVDSGDAHAMQWREVERNVVRDWQEAFAGEVPAISGVAIGADTDNTSDEVTAWFGDLRFLKTP